ncbi:ABC-type nitrate/sulfonate/bicarbonate transport system substrate-binding protein [Glaciihabitans tibetensis]|uniref:ABC-type nitrate/sulfonate/bicarbonate transport system substrate-binding protein n=1 Tax=Glaciihabitans tibetensis TaxID=1266600 RepID=A0A2T0VDV0_9MICO|nr:ABC transporter substrate-binding protein [Glaciihabitans tibetensis]PRY68353.1 ABC-type nitrate/sulfonate/bicarbonate transport system substrate-binding protein [Glaciihabitans tibetensis]
MRSELRRLHSSKARWAGTALLATGALLLSGCAAEATPAAVTAAECETTTDTHLLLSTFDLDVSYIPYGILADELGYFDEECLNMTLDVTSTGATQALLGDQTDFAMSGPEQLVSANGGASIGAKMVYNYIPNLNIYLGVLADSDIESTADLAGKTIGLEGTSSMYDAFLTESLKPHGLGLSDITTIVTGYGSTPAEALKSGEVDAVLYWPGLFTSWEAAGYDIRILDGTEWSAGFDGIGLAARDDTITDDPELVESVSRAIARSTVYLQRYPESAVRIFWKAYPERAPLPGADEDAAMERDLAVLDSTLESMGAMEQDEDYTWGIQTEERWTSQIAYMQKAATVDAAAVIDANDFFTAEFTEAANDFDLDEITEQ